MMMGIQLARALVVVGVCGLGAFAYNDPPKWDCSRCNDGETGPVQGTNTGEACTTLIGLEEVEGVWWKPPAAVTCRNPDNTTDGCDTRLCCGSGFTAYWACLRRYQTITCQIFFQCATPKCCANGASVTSILKPPCGTGASYQVLACD